MSTEIETIEIPGIGTARLLPAGILGKIELLVNDTPVKVDGFGRFELWRDNGPVKGRVAFAFTRSKPDIVVGDVKYPLGHPFPLWLVVLSCLPLALVAIGGAIGAMFGVIGFMLNRRLLGLEMSDVVKALATIGTTVVTYFAAVAASAWVQAMFL